MSNPGSCCVYWGSHGCMHPRFHDKSVPHECDCCDCDGPNCGPCCVAKPPYYRTVETIFYGEDAEYYGLKTHEDKK